MNTSLFAIDTGGATDTGRVRDHNEDSFAVQPERGVWVVADGMGGHDAGDFASQTITQEMLSLGFAISSGDLQARFLERLGRAHTRIREHAESLGGGTVGSTVVGLLIHEDQFSAIWSGDSRIYRMRGGQLSQITKDHTEVQELLDAGMIAPDEAATWPRKNVITRAIGVSEEPQCDIVTGEISIGDAFLLCSDGLTEHSSDMEISAVIAAATTAQEACDALIARTLDQGAKDNVTAVVIAVSPPREDAGQ